MENIPQLQFKSGLKKHWHSRKDWSHHKTFGASPLSSLPAEYLLVSTVLNQGASEKCTAFSACAIAESAYGRKFDPELFYADEGVVAGGFSNDGYDIRTTMKTGVDKGFRLLATDAPFFEGSYFIIDGPYDLFDNIRTAMWIAQMDKKCAEIGTELYLDWLNSPQGIVPDSFNRPMGLHAMKCAGWKTINNVLYLAMQNSFGEGYADKGVFYFDRSIVNKYFTEGHYLWRKKPPIPQIVTVGVMQSFLANASKILISIALALGFSK